MASSSSSRRSGGKPRIYPWEKWFAKRSFKLVQGRDFTIAPYAMAQAVRNRARADGLAVSVQVFDDGIAVSVNGAI